MLNRAMEGVLKFARKTGECKVMVYLPLSPWDRQDKGLSPPRTGKCFSPGWFCWERRWRGWKWGIRLGLAPWEAGWGEPGPPAPSNQAVSYFQRCMWWPMWCGSSKCIVLKSKLGRRKRLAFMIRLSAYLLRMLLEGDNTHCGDSVFRDLFDSNILMKG